MDNLKQRLMQGKRDSAAQGRHQGGTLPYGYIKTYNTELKAVILKVEPFEASIVMKMYRDYLKFRSLSRVVDTLNSCNIPTRNGKSWSRPGVGFILSNELYIGKIKYGTVKAKGLHCPIISPIVFNKVQQLKQQNLKKKK